MYKKLRKPTLHGRPPSSAARSKNANRAIWLRNIDLKKKSTKLGDPRFEPRPKFKHNECKGYRGKTVRFVFVYDNFEDRDEDSCMFPRTMWRLIPKSMIVKTYSTIYVLPNVREHTTFSRKHVFPILDLQVEKMYCTEEDKSNVASLPVHQKLDEQIPFST